MLYPTLEGLNRKYLFLFRLVPPEGCFAADRHKVLRSGVNFLQAWQA